MSDNPTKPTTNLTREELEMQSSNSLESEGIKRRGFMSGTTRKDDELRMEIIRKTSTRMSLSDVDIVMQIVKQYGVKERVEKACIDTPNSQSSVDSKDESARDIDVPTKEERKLEGIAMNIVFQIGDSLYETLPKDIAHEHFVTARQETNDEAIDFAKELIKQYGIQERISLCESALLAGSSHLDPIQTAAATGSYIVSQLTALKDKQETK